MTRVLITGGTGLLGSHLAQAFARAGYEVRTLDVNEPEPRDAGRYDFVGADVRDLGAVREAVRGCDVVVDNAALVPVTRASPELYRSVNVDGCRVTLQAAEEEGAYVLHISSSAIYGVPADLPVTSRTAMAPFEPYGASKAQAELAVNERRARGVTVASLRPRGLLGAGRLGLFDVIFSRIRKGKRVPMFGRGLNRVQMCDMEDFCDAALAAVAQRANGAYNIGAAEFGTVREDLTALIERAGTGARLQPLPVPVLCGILIPLEILGRSPFTKWHWRSAAASFWCDLSDARTDLAWTPRFSNVDALWRAYSHYLEGGHEVGTSAHRTPLDGGLARVLRG